MDKNCLDCFNFNDNTSTCKTMQEPPENCFCFVANIKQKLEQEKDCLRYVIDHGNACDLKKQSKIVVSLMEAIQRAAQ
jgi:hypothetical protein